MKGRVIISLVTLIIASPSFAMLCPGNFNQINIGDTLAAVKAACGAPTAESSSNDTEEGPQEWVYYVSVNSAFYQNVSQSTQTSLKTSVAFDNGKVANISVNGVGVSSTSVCGGTIAAGDTPKTVQAVCGKPAFINRGTGSQAGTQSGGDSSTKNTVLTYSNGTDNTTLVFVNGVLTERK